MARRGPKIHITGELPKGADPVRIYEREWDHRKKILEQARGVKIAAPAVGSQLEAVEPIPEGPVAIGVQNPGVKEVSDIMNGERVRAQRRAVRRQVELGEIPLRA